MMKNFVFILALVLLFSCEKPPRQPELVDNFKFKAEHEGQTVRLFTLKNRNGLVAQITNYGGRIVNFWTPDREGNFDDIVIGYNSLEEYLNSNEIYYGTLIGRYGNRIANGEFELNDSVYTLAKNNGENHLHGGEKGFNNVVWEAKQLDDYSLELKYISKNGEEGYPGNLEVTVLYQLNNDNELEVEY